MNSIKLFSRHYNAVDERIKNIYEIMDNFSPKIKKDINPVINMEALLNDCGVSSEDVNKLNIIHVAGTKGKGSTCAFTESILRHHGYRTGFYSSPKIINICDRVRINGIPVSADTYLRHLKHNFDSIKTPLPSTGKDKILIHKRPAILTAVAITIFIEEKVDVVILETILGGTFDETNFVKDPVVCGITQIDLDHCKFLGSTIQSIAGNKAGIIKQNVPVFVQDQSKDAMNVFRKTATEKNSALFTIPNLSAYTSDNKIVLGLDGNFQKPNASLALQLANYWMSEYKKRNVNTIKPHPLHTTAVGFKLNTEYLDGLKYCQWPCRAQVVKKRRITFYLEGAHTPLSCQCCADWFKEKVKIENSKLSPSSKVKTFIVFSSKAGKNTLENFKPFRLFQFDKIILTLSNQVKANKYLERIDTMAPLLKDLKDTHKNTETEVLSFGNNFDTLDYLENEWSSSTKHINVLVTGSLELCALIYNEI